MSDALGHRPHELHADERAHFMGTTGFVHSLDGDGGHGQVTIGPYLMTGPRWPNVSVLLTCADILIGTHAFRTGRPPRVSVTAELSVQVVGALPDDGRLELRSALIKTGQSMSVGETEIVGARSGQPVAMAIGTFLASPRPQDVVPEGLELGVHTPRHVTPTGATLVEHVGLQVVTPGVCEMALRPDLSNATRSLQGGLVAMLGEMAAQSAASAAAGEPHVVDGLDVRYLAAAPVGPFVARAKMLAADRARVEIRDPGRDDRIVSVVYARTRPAPPAVEP